MDVQIFLYPVVLDDQPMMIMTIFEHGEGEQNEDDVSVNFINLWSSHTTGLSEKGGGQQRPDVLLQSDRIAYSSKGG